MKGRCCCSCGYHNVTPDCPQHKPTDRQCRALVSRSLLRQVKRVDRSEQFRRDRWSDVEERPSCTPVSLDTTRTLRDTTSDSGEMPAAFT